MTINKILLDMRSDFTNDSHYTFFYKDTAGGHQAEIIPKIKEKLRTLPSLSFGSKYNKF